VRRRDEACNVHELHRRRTIFGVHDRGELLQAWIGHRHDPDVRVDRAKGVVLGGDLRARQRVEQGRLTDVRQTYDAAANRHEKMWFL
jgi:hypothetical protein